MSKTSLLDQVNYPSDLRKLKEEELKLELIRNKILGGVLVLVIFVLLVFK